MPSTARALTAHSRVDVDDPAEFAFWCGFFDTTETELAAAMSVVGNSVALLDEHFGTRQAS